MKAVKKQLVAAIVSKDRQAWAAVIQRINDIKQELDQILAAQLQLQRRLDAVGEAHEDIKGTQIVDGKNEKGVIMQNYHTLLNEPIDEGDHIGKTPLTLAYELNRAIIPDLVKLGALLWYTDKQSETISDKAVNDGNLAIIKTLLELGADFNSGNFRLSPLTKTIENPNHTDQQTKAILQATCDVTQTNAKEEEKESKSSELQPPVTQQGPIAIKPETFFSLLKDAIDTKKLETIAFLCAQISPSFLSSRGIYVDLSTVLSLAAYVLHPPLKLTDQDRKVILQTIFANEAVLMVAAQGKNCGKWSCSDFGCSIHNCKNLVMDNSPLFNAVKEGYIEAVSFVLSKTKPEVLDITIGNELVLTAAQYADENATLLKIIFNQKFKTNVNHFNAAFETPLHLANSVAAVEVLMLEGANPFLKQAPDKLSALEVYVQKYQQADANKNLLLAKIVAALKHCPAKLLYSENSQEQLLGILYRTRQKNKELLPVVLRYIKNFDGILDFHARLISIEITQEKQRRTVLNAEQDKIENTERQRLNVLIQKNMRSIEFIHKNIPESKADDKTPATPFKNFADYVINKAKEQSVDDFAPRWIGLVVLIRHLQKKENDKIKIPGFIKTVAAMVTKMLSSNTLAGISANLLPQYADATDIEKLKTDCQQYLTHLENVNPIFSKTLQEWINNDIFSQQQQAVVQPAQQQAAIPAAQQQAAAPANQKQKPEIAEAVAHHRHPVPSMNPVTAGEWHELAQLRPAAAVQPEQNQQQQRDNSQRSQP